MAGIKGKSGGKREGAGPKKLPPEEKRDIIFQFKVNKKEKEIISKKFSTLKKQLKTKVNVDILLYLLEKYEETDTE